ncbi:hypothetical protein RFI_21756 [Reticulomyxa filosa]|uniref:non-specific serine/threonine protein kinase n=1 Tax=Reticulomyxa filosa TaxID=46433 RepID=X6MNM9_RETFI|nr:hypothetical protein RFI_21756 [Reticulomyxa filosa]|eukprot:ETO15608.1 hypothetical protein RFI_21756 [Reticulomyxa filosa]
MFKEKKKSQRNISTFTQHFNSSIFNAQYRYIACCVWAFVQCERGINTSVKRYEQRWQEEETAIIKRNKTTTKYILMWILSTFVHFIYSIFFVFEKRKKRIFFPACLMEKVFIFFGLEIRRFWHFKSFNRVKQVCTNNDWNSLLYESQKYLKEIHMILNLMLNIYSKKILFSKINYHTLYIWSLGCVLYEILTFRHAFDTNNIGLLVQKIVKGQFEPISTSTYSSEILALIDLFLNVEPTNRPLLNDILVKTENFKTSIRDYCNGRTNLKKNLESQIRTELHMDWIFDKMEELSVTYLQKKQSRKKENAIGNPDISMLDKFVQKEYQLNLELDMELLKLRQERRFRQLENEKRLSKCLKNREKELASNIIDENQSHSQKRACAIKKHDANQHDNKQIMVIRAGDKQLQKYDPTKKDSNIKKDGGYVCRVHRQSDSFLNSNSHGKKKVELNRDNNYPLSVAPKAPAEVAPRYHRLYIPKKKQNIHEQLNCLDGQVAYFFFHICRCFRINKSKKKEYDMLKQFKQLRERIQQRLNELEKKHALKSQEKNTNIRGRAQSAHSSPVRRETVLTHDKGDDLDLEKGNERKSSKQTPVRLKDDRFSQKQTESPVKLIEVEKFTEKKSSDLNQKISLQPNQLAQQRGNQFVTPTQIKITSSNQQNEQFVTSNNILAENHGATPHLPITEESVLVHKDSRTEGEEDISENNLVEMEMENLHKTLMEYRKQMQDFKKKLKELAGQKCQHTDASRNTNASDNSQNSESKKPQDSELDIESMLLQQEKQMSMNCNEGENNSENNVVINNTNQYKLKNQKERDEISHLCIKHTDVIEETSCESSDGTLAEKLALRAEHIKKLIFDCKKSTITKIQCNMGLKEFEAIYDLVKNMSFNENQERSLEIQNKIKSICEGKQLPDEQIKKLRSYIVELLLIEINCSNFVDKKFEIYFRLQDTCITDAGKLFSEAQLYKRVKHNGMLSNEFHFKENRNLSVKINNLVDILKYLDSCWFL